MKTQLIQDEKEMEDLFKTVRYYREIVNEKLVQDHE